MAQDRPKQPNIQQELVRAAIIKLRASGLEISPHTVAVEANIPRSTIYRNAEMMELINKEGGVGIESESPFQTSAEDRIAELKAHIEEQDQRIWDLEKENEDLHSEVENAWTMGFQAGLAEGNRRHDEPETEPVTAKSALVMATGEHQFLRSTGNHAALKPKPSTADMSSGGEITGDHQAYNPDKGGGDESVYQIDIDVDEIAIKTNISGGHTPVQPAQTSSQTKSTAPAQSQIETQAHPKLQPQLQPQVQPQAQPQAQAPTVSRSLQPAQSSESVQPLTASPSQPPSPSRAQPQVTAPTSDIYNATRSGPYTGNNFSPLVELSWKDLETVYNFRVESLMDYSRNIPSASSPVRPPASSERGNGASKPIIADYIDPEILEMVPTDEDIASLQNLEARVFMSEEGDNGHAQKFEQLAAPPYQSGLDLVPQNPPFQSFPNPQITARLNPDETGDRIEAIPEQDLAEPDSSQVNLAEAHFDEAIDSEPVVDLDSLDIFDDIDEYNIETLAGHAKKAAEDSAAGMATAGDELRNLIKGRIQSAAELPHEPIQSKVSPKTSLTNMQPISEEQSGGMARSRSKFIGGSKGESASADARKSSFVVKQIPPEIRKASHILGLRPEELTQAQVIAAWKTLIASPGVHPDLGGDTESAVFLNIAKDTIIKWLDQQAPKLGKKFGHPSEVTKPPLRPEPPSDR